MLQNGKMERRTKSVQDRTDAKKLTMLIKSKLRYESWAAIFLKVYVIETQNKTCVFKVKKLLFLTF